MKSQQQKHNDISKYIEMVEQDRYSELRTILRVKKKIHDFNLAE